LISREYRYFARCYNWWAETPNAVQRIEPALRPWVTDRGSLTAALIRLSDDYFQVRVLRERIAVPYFHEQKKLGRPYQLAALIREVELEIHGEAVVYARSIVPLSLVTNGRNGLANLGRTPLGHLLFKDGRIRVSKRELTSFCCDDDSIAARRTPYDYQGTTILVSEFFLPSFRRYLSR
jgi:chorismate--pyruvate lyase